MSTSPSPAAALDYFKKPVVTAPANKLLLFGGDCLPVEPVLGHAILVRRGIAHGLTELVDEGGLALSDALGLVDPVLHGHARRIFRLTQKREKLRTAPWLHRPGNPASGPSTPTAPESDPARARADGEGGNA